MYFTHFTSKSSCYQRFTTKDTAQALPVSLEPPVAGLGPPVAGPEAPVAGLEPPVAGREAPVAGPEAPVAGKLALHWI